MIIGITGHIRNKYICNNVDLLIAVFNGERGGTYNCIQYAKSIKKEILYVDPKEYNRKT